MADVVQTEAPTPVSHQEKVAGLYGDKYLRESEVRTLHSLLQDHPSVMVMGSIGRGKSTFMSEAFYYTREMKKHGGVARSVFFFDLHELDRHIRLLEGTESTPEDIAKTAHPILDWLDHQRQGPDLQDIPPTERPILFIDAGDVFFLEHLGSEYFPAYKSTQWRPIELLEGKPDAQQGYLRQYVRQAKAEKETIRVDMARVLNRPLPTPETPEQIELWVNWAMHRFPKYRAFEETREQLFNKVIQALQEGRVRVVLTDHGYSRESMKAGGEGVNRQACLYMLERYNQLFADSYRYDLPASYQTGKARTFLQRRGVNDLELQDEIIEATGAEHKLLTLAITPEVIQTLNTAHSEEHRKGILQRAVESYVESYKK